MQARSDSARSTNGARLGAMLAARWWNLVLRGSLAILIGAAIFLWPDVSIDVLDLFLGVWLFADGATMAFGLVAYRKRLQMLDATIGLGIGSVILLSVVDEWGRVVRSGCCVGDRPSDRATQPCRRAPHCASQWLAARRYGRVDSRVRSTSARESLRHCVRGRLDSGVRDPFGVLICRARLLDRTGRRLRARRGSAGPKFA